MECLFCKIINKEIPSYKVYESDYVYAFLDITPKSFGHTLVIPKTHVKDIFEVNTDFNFLEEIKIVANLLKDKLECEGMNINVNNGAIAGQEVFHLHFHLVPRYSNEIDANDFEKVMECLND